MNQGREYARRNADVKSLPRMLLGKEKKKKKKKGGKEGEGGGNEIKRRTRDTRSKDYECLAKMGVHDNCVMDAPKRRARSG